MRKETKMIKIEHLTKRFSSLVAVDDVSLDIEDGQCFALLGLNGAGKTTLVGMLSTSLKPTSGTAKFDELDLVKDKKDIRKIVNISPQEVAVAKILTVKENLMLIASLYSIKEKDSRVEEIIKDFGLTEKANVLCKKLSGGQLRRLSIALAIISEPQVLFLDEPTLGLDVKARKVLWEIIEKLKSRVTIILTTHYLDEVEFLADRIAIMSRGKIVAQGTRDEILQITHSQNLEEAFLKLSEEEI